MLRVRDVTTEETLRRLLTQKPSRTRDETRTFVQFALTSLRETPVGPGQTPWGIVTDPRFRQMLETAQNWVDGGPYGEDECNAGDTASLIARELVGDYHHEVTGHAAAVWAAAFTIEATSEAFRVGERIEGMLEISDQDEDDANSAVESAIYAANTARRSAVGEYEVTAVRHQFDLACRLWPEAPGTNS